MTACADSTMLRTHLDHPDRSLDAHLDDCETCSGLLHSVAEDAGYAHRALAMLEPPAVDVDVDAALARVLAARPAAPLATATPRRSPGAGRRLLLAAAAALVVVAVSVTPAGRSAIASTLDAFRGERIQAVRVDLESWADAPIGDGVRALRDLGELDVRGLSEPEQVAGIAEAEARSGITAPGLPSAPDRVVALAPGTAELRLIARDGNGVPDELDGALLLVDVPGAIGAVYGPEDGMPELVVARSGRLGVRAEGAPLEDVRAFLLSRDELPEDLRAQLADIDDWRSTVPVPVPLDGPGWEEVEVGGRPAIAFGDDSGFGALVLRQDPDGVTVVGGRITVSRALELATGA